MNRERWRKLEEIYQAALELPEAERPEFVRKRCRGDADLRQEVASLLSQEKVVGSFLEEVALPVNDEEQEGDRMIGQTISHYRISRMIGKGGMGEVYLAEDTTLPRKVALKFLPRELQQDEVARKRFIREAGSIAAIDHPFICNIFEVGEFEGKAFLALEYVEGPSLAERLAEGPLALEQAFQIAGEIAQALEEAHKKGIVHRDLKPSNIMLTPQGHAKVMDFGLAKRVTGGEAQESTVTPLTRAGSTPGTVAYMSPEQLKDEEVDTRSDIFSFGIVLYEMLTGVHPFRKPEAMATASSILQDEPAPVGMQREGISAVVQYMVRKMLAKDPGRRYQLVRDIHTDLMAWQDSGSIAAAENVDPAPQKQFWSLPLWLLLPIVVVAAAGGWALRPTARAPDQTGGLNLELVANQDIVWDSLVHPGFAISPDGNHLVFSEIDSPELQIRDLRDGSQRGLQGSEGGGNPFFSPDGLWVGFFVLNKGLCKMPIAGGPVELLVASAEGQGSWGSDGRIVYAQYFAGLRVVSSRGGEPRMLIPPSAEDKGIVVSNPVWLPDKAGILFTRGLRPQQLAVLAPESGEYKELQVPGNVSQIAYVETGHLVYNRQDTLYAVAFDLKTLETLGPEIPLLRGVLYSRANIGSFSLSRTGTLVYVPGTRALRELVQVSRDGEITVLPAEPDYYLDPRVSPDGRQISVLTAPTRTDTTRWIVNRKSESRILLEERYSGANWPWIDSERVLKVSEDALGNERFLYAVKADGSGEENLLTELTGPIRWFRPNRFDSEGRHLIAQVLFSEDTDSKMAYLDFEEPSLELREVMPDMILAGGRSQFWGSISPNQNWAVYSEWVPARRRQSNFDQNIWATSFPVGESRRLVADRALKPLWSADGRIYFWRPEEGLLFVETGTEAGFQFSEPRTFLNFEEQHIHPGYNFVVPNWDVSWDGEFLVMVRTVDETRWKPPSHFKVLTNFLDLLREKVPAGTGK